MSSNNTSNAGLFGQPLDGDLLFDQISGPKLFMPIPVSTPEQSPQPSAPAVSHSDSSLHSVHQHAQSLQHQKPTFQDDTNLSFTANQNVEQNFYVQQNLASQGLDVSPLGSSHSIQHIPTNHSFPTQQQPAYAQQHQVKPQLATGQHQYFQQQQPSYQLQEAHNHPAQQHLSQNVDPYGGNTSTSLQEQKMHVMSSPSNVTPYNMQQKASPQRPTQVVQPIPKQLHTATTNDILVSGTQPNFSPHNAPPQLDSTLLQDPNIPSEYNISPLPARSEHPHGAPLPLPPSSPHWFYFKDYKKWTPFSYYDSNRLEAVFMITKSGKVTSTDGGRYDVNLDTMKRNAVYWSEAPCAVRRCTWFYKGGVDGKLIPYEEAVAEVLEQEYVSMMKNCVFNVKVDITPTNFVIFHNPNVLVQYASNPQQQGWTGEDSAKRPKVVRRGIPEEFQGEIQQGEGAEIDHLVLVVHGIGIFSDLRYRSIVECVDDFRRISCNQIASHNLTYNGKASNRVEFLPIQWHSCVHEERSVDRELKKLTLPSIGKMRNFVNDTLTDILFFTSPIYCQAMCDTVVGEMNRIYKLFKSRNPLYTGSVSLIGHSLGSCILFDILAGQVDKGKDDECYMYEDVGDVIDVSSTSLQNTPQSSLELYPTLTSPNETDVTLPSIEVLCEKLNLLNLLQMFKEEQMDTETILMCSEADLRDLGIPFGPRKKLISYISGQSNEKKAQQSLNPGVSSPKVNSSSTRGTQTPVPLDSSGSDGSNEEFLFEKTKAGIGQPLVKYAKLEFETSCLFCLGSPIGLFLTSRGIHSIGTDFKLPMCSEFMNIFHPYDPVAYRVEPLINENIDLPSSLIPHHKGRKRIHLEIKENLSRAGAQIKHSILDAVNRTWTSINDFAKAHRSVDTEEAEGSKDGNDIVEGTEEIGSISSDNTLDSLEETEVSLKERALDFGKLNNGGRVDYVLQENPIESLNEYIFALSSHLCYWTSDDTALLVVDKIYKRLR